MQCNIYFFQLIKNIFNYYYYNANLNLLLIIPFYYYHSLESESEIVVTWSTWNNTDESVVKYGINGPILTAFGTSTLFIDGGELHRTQYIHRAKLTNLQPSSKYGNCTLYKLSN